MNRCVLIGNLTRDPELKTTTSGKSVCNFTIAVGRRFSSPSGERETDFIPVVVWNKQAENAAKYLRKGSQCCVAGAIQTRNYEAKDGSRRYITEIIADEVQFLSRAGESSKSSESTSSSTTPEDMQEINEDLPF
ncbi:MAG: single-stranded DNA-binding protein [Clostridiales bacterium]|nr:single-stranded DNA-binding protein [Clostridiales bacterium]